MDTANIGELFHDKCAKMLNQAVKEGEPVDFSNSYDNQIYSIEKLLPRVRCLCYLMMDYNPISNRIRKLFLPDALCENTDVIIVGEDISVCSIRGGPGYDHLSLCILASFLRHVQSSVNGNSFRTRVVMTRVFDVFDDDWKTSWSHLGSA